MSAGVRAEGVFELGIGETGEGGFDCAVDAATFLVGVLRGDGRFVINCAFEPPRIETRVAIAVGGAHLELEERLARGRSRCFRLTICSRRPPNSSFHADSHRVSEVRSPRHALTSSNRPTKVWLATVD